MHDADRSLAADTFIRLARPRVSRPWLEPVVAALDARMTQDGGHDYGHLLRVLANAERIHEDERARGREASWDAIAAAVVLHDVVNLPKDHPRRHEASTLSAEATVEILGGVSAFPRDLVATAAEAVRTHSFSAGLVAESLEARVVCDADRLESIGAFAIARTFYVSGALGRSICHLEDPFARGRALDDREFGVDHFFAKLLRLRERLYTESARALASHRHARMLAFLEGLRDELGLPAESLAIAP